MTRDEFKKLYPDVEEGEVSPEEFHQTIKVSNGSIINENEKWDPKWDTKLSHLMDKQFWEGFKAARAVAENVLDGYDIPGVTDDIRDELEEELDNYCKDG